MITLPATDVSAAVEQAAPALNSTTPLKARDDPASGPRNWFNRIEWLVAILIALYATALHVRFVTNVGGLWRDETNSVNLATLPSFADIWSLLEYDSFPIVFVTVLRAWVAIFGPENDAALRFLGLLIGLGVLGVLFRNAHSLGARAPVLSLALIGLNPMLVRYGDSTRAYGLGIIFILLTFRSFWRLVDSPSPPSLKRVLAATILALLSVHCLYYNSVLLFAIAAGAVAVALRARAWRTVGIVLAIGSVAAASLLVYMPMMRRLREWAFLVSYPTDLAWLWKRACEVIGSPDPLGIWLWVALFIVGLGVVASFAIARVLPGFYRWHRSAGAQPPIPAAVLFAAVALSVGVAGYAGFLGMLHYYTQPWYYITLVAFVACPLDILFGAWPTAANLRLSLLLRGVRVVAALALLFRTALPVWEEMPARHTNVNLLATELRSLATKDDIILVSHWEFAITLCRYYRGPAEIISLPPITDHSFHRYDLVLRQMKTNDPLRIVRARVEEALRSGHRVFLAGALPFPHTALAMPALPLAYGDPGGDLSALSYVTIWRLQAGQFLHAHARSGRQIQPPSLSGAPAPKFENLALGVFEGWQ